MNRSRRTLAVLGAATVLAGVGLPGAASAAAPDRAITVALDGLASPTHIAFDRAGRLYVADAFTGNVLRSDLRGGAPEVLASGLGFSPGIDVSPSQQVYVTLSGQPETGSQQGPTSLARVVGGQARQVADLLAFEKAQNPDGQPQRIGPRQDALSNPYDVLAAAGKNYVADAAGNTILEVTNRTGAVRALTVLPVSRKGECATATNNGVPNGGCDPVPTALALGPDGNLYVSGLGAEVEGHVWKIDPASGRILRHWDGLPPLTGIAVGAQGVVYASSIFADTIFRIPATGAPSTVSVHGPAGLRLRDGVLYAGSVDLAGQAPGQVLRIPLAAFSAP